MVAVQESRFELCGPVRTLARRTLKEGWCPPEVLLEGPAGTGKTLGTLQIILALLEQHPKSRVALVRKTRVSMTESTLVTWENKVLWPEHPVFEASRAGRAQRKSYDFPNGSTLVPCGMDNPSRLFSTEWDIIYVNEATELVENEFELLHRGLRNGMMPFHSLWADCNPDAETHWLNLRPERLGPKKMPRLVTRHHHNPGCTDEYLERLRSMAGVRRQRMYEGKWVTAEGMIWDEYKPEVHRVYRGERTPKKPWGDKLPDFVSFLMSQDWGYSTDPGVQQLWGITQNGAMYRIEETYRTRKMTDWWAGKMADRYKRTSGAITYCACDPSEPEHIAVFNRQAGEIGRRMADPIAVKAKNAINPGNDVVNLLLRERKMFFVYDSIDEADPDLVEMAKPCCTEQEIPGYVWAKNEDGKPVKSHPDPNCVDHGCDATRYAAVEHYGLDYAELAIRQSADEGMPPKSRSTWHFLHDEDDEPEPDNGLVW